MNPAEQNILIIDDDELFVDLLIEQLVQLGFSSIQWAADGNAALRAIDENIHFFDLILCDLEMPGMDGIEILRHLTQRSFAGGVVVVTGAGDHLLSSVEKLGRLHALRMLGALSKPVSGQALWKVISHPIDMSAKKPAPAADAVLEISVKELEAALGHDQFKLYYQPQVDLRTDKIVGVESLLRWNHPRLGPISPMRFVAQAEHLGLIDKLTERVLRVAVAQGAEWRALGLPLNISVNVSMQNLQSLTLPEFLASMTRRLRFPLDCLTLELNESQLVTNPASALEILVRLRLRGMGIAIDDFGTGYADLEHLSELPFTELKIDRFFVANAFKKPSAMEILKTTVDLAKKLNLKVAAEGVETQKQWNLVKEIGCDVAQGYHIAKPMPAEHIQAWLHAWNETTNTIKSAYGMAMFGA
ncbi:MAG: EAL domain-containing protein [Candidatus Methylumidiphilus sp.]